ncbi:MAG: PorT family protein [Bacteroidales bacterium]|nr:PorT family protein [Bacteroidales bacterium]
MDKPIDNKQYDALGELFRRKLEDHQIAVEGNDWNVIEQRLAKRKNNKAAIWWWSSGAAAALIALLLLIDRPIVDERPLAAVSQQKNREEPATADNEARPKPVTTELLPEKGAMPVSQNPVSAFPDLSENVNLVEKNKSQTEDIVADLQSVDDIADSASRVNETISSTELSIPLTTNKDKFEEKNITKKTKNWLLAATFGIGGSTESSSGKKLFGSNEYAATRSGSIQLFNDMVRDDFTNISHSLPFSFGLMVRKDIGKNIAIESGLVYTYLASKFEWFNYDVRQSLHYIGVPVNMVLYLWNANPHWKIYLSGGFMVEKGLRGIYTQEIEIWNARYTTTVKGSIDGLQWSINGAFGVNYKINNRLGIYFEPRAGYCFDNHQPISMRTEWPVNIGVNLGLNYEF